MFTLNCKGRILTLHQPAVMGIINTTPDSFYSGSRAVHLQEVVDRAGHMLEEGAVILDLGGQSTRPGSERVPQDEELERVVPAIAAVHRAFPEAILSVDTYYASVAREASGAGASMINDVSAGTLDEALIPAVLELGLPYVLMHFPGDPKTMQSDPKYGNVTLDVFDFLNRRCAELTSAGLHDIVVDPGFGFGKTAAHNFRLLHQLSFFRQLGRPLMVGLSRKATVYRTLGIAPEEALNGTTVLHTIALLHGAAILRVHDVREAVQAVRLLHAYDKEKEQP